MKKSFHWFFYSYALVDQDIPLCSTITPTVPNRWHTEVRTPPSLVPDVVVFFSTVLSETRTKALMPGACSYRLLHSSAHSEQHFTTQRPRLRRSLERDAQFLLLCAFSQQLGQLQQHPHELLSIFRSVSPSELQKPHSFSNEQSHNAMTVNT